MVRPIENERTRLKNRTAPHGSARKNSTEDSLPALSCAKENSFCLRSATLSCAKEKKKDAAPLDRRASVADTYGVPIEAEATPRKLADPFDYGGGHIDPNKAADPGLVYDIDPNYYTKFFNCTLGPSDECDTSVGQLYQLNVPSIAVPDLKDIVSVFRTVTNVGPANSTYKAFVQPPAGVTVFIEPNLISFNSSKNVETFKVTFVANCKVKGDYTFGSLIWSDSLNHSVRIPIAVRTIIQDFYADTA